MKSEVLQLSRFALHSALSVVKVGAESGSWFDSEAEASGSAKFILEILYFDTSGINIKVAGSLYTCASSLKLVME